MHWGHDMSTDNKNGLHPTSAAYISSIAAARVSDTTSSSGAAPGYGGESGGASFNNRDIAFIMQSLREQGMLVPNSSLPPEVRHEYRRIKRPLLSNAFGKSASLVDKGNLIMVTSSVPGEGKTYTSINLALAIA